MKALTCLLLLAAVTTTAGFAAETKAPPPAPMIEAAKSPVAGKFDGTWHSTNNEANGKLKLAFKPDGDKWAVEASFTYQGADVATKLKSLKVDGAKIALVIEYAIDGATTGSTLLGEVRGDKLEGSYETYDGGHGSWSVTRG